MSADDAGARGGGGMAPAFLTLFAFVSFSPYPALSIGNRTGLQLSEMMAIAMIPLIFAGRPTRILYACLLLMVPQYISAAVATARGVALEFDIINKEVIASNLAVCVLVPMAWLARRDRFGRVLACAAVATLGHLALGLYQVYAFSKGEFPFIFLYVNPSFKSIESWGELYALYMKRPCGLFPEPSAMSASLGPWLVVLSGVLSEPILSRWYCGSKRAYRLLGASLVGGLVLLALSRSGLAPMVILAVTAVVFAHVFPRRRSLRPGAILGGLLVIAIAVGALGYLLVSFQSNLEDRVESSWGLRSMSIVTALTANTEPVDFVFGVGPGQSTAIIRKLLAGVPLSNEQDEMSVWSVSVTYYMEVGVLGAVGMLVVFAMLVRALWRSSARFLGLATLGIWAAAVTITTSYAHLSPVWLMLGALMEWDAIFPTDGETAGDG